MQKSIGFWATANALPPSGPVLNWQQVATSVALSYTGSAYAPLANGKWFAFGGAAPATATTAYSYSQDGVTWNTGTLPSAQLWGKAAASGTRLFVLTTRGASTVGAYTDNGTTWTSVTVFAGNQQTYELIYDGTQFVAAVNNNTINIAYSTTGVGWVTVDSGVAASSVGYDGISRYIVLSATGGSIQVTSTTGLSGTWSNITFPSSQSWQSIVYGNGTWFALSPGGGATSSNGTTWTARTTAVNFQTASAPYQKIAFYRGAFYGFATSNNTVRYSLDPTGGSASWVTAFTASGLTNFQAPLNITGADNKVLIVGWNGLNAAFGITEALLGTT